MINIKNIKTNKLLKSGRPSDRSSGRPFDILANT